MWVLVHWVETNDVTVTSSKFVLDEKMLQDPELEGLVEYGRPGEKPPKHGWEVYRAKVLVANEKKSIVVKKEREFLNAIGAATEEDMAMELSDSESDMEQPSTSKKSTKKRTKKADRTAMGDLMKKQKVVIPENKESFEELKTIVKEVVKEAIKEDLREAVQAAVTVAVKEAMEAVKSFKAPKISSPSSSKTSLQIAASSPQMAATSPQGVSSLQGTAAPIEGQSTATPPKVEEFLTATQIRVIDQSTAPSKMVCNLMNAIFTTTQMRECIVSGNRRKEGEEAKQVLDQDKVQFVVDYTTSKFPSTTTGQVRAKMGQKVKDTRAAYRRAEKQGSQE